MTGISIRYSFAIARAATSYKKIKSVQLSADDAAYEQHSDLNVQQLSAELGEENNFKTAMNFHAYGSMLTHPCPSFLHERAVAEANLHLTLL